MTRSSLKTQTLVRAVVALGILVLVNIISIRLFGRLDLTRNGLFTLSQASRTLVSSLDDRVTVKAYFTEDLPAPYNATRRTVLDQLNEYKAYAGGNLQFEFIDPTGEAGEQEAQQQGIAPVQVQVLREDKFEVKRAYMGMVFLYEDRKEVLPVIQNTATLEYEVSSTIKRLTSRTRKAIGFLSGHGEPGLNELTRAQELLRRQYDVQTVSLSGIGAVPVNLSALIVMAPTSPLSDVDRFKIDQYLMQGGRVAFLLNRVQADLQNQYGRALDVGLDGMLEAYGLRINPDLVRDMQCASVSIVQQQFGFSIQSQVPFPYLPLASSLNPDNPIVKDLKGLVLFFVSSVDTTGLALRGLSGEILVRSSAQSGRQTGLFMFDPLQQFTREQFGEQGIPLAVLVTGRLTSAFAGKPVPADTAPGAPPPPARPLTEGSDTRLLLVGDGDFARDQYLGNRDNLTFLANAIDYLVDDAGLITIRSKDASVAPLEQVSDGTKRMFKYGTLAIPPLLVVGYGLFRWRMRRARRKALEMQ
jgi:gliding-associated putative ABC transporter substrate-binding component GldG